AASTAPAAAGWRRDPPAAASRKPLARRRHRESGSPSPRWRSARGARAPGRRSSEPAAPSAPAHGPPSPASLVTLEELLEVGDPRRQELVLLGVGGLRQRGGDLADVPAGLVRAHRPGSRRPEE